MTRLEALQSWIGRAATKDASPAQRRNVQELKRLADSIAQHGLISPISVRQPDPNEANSPDVEYIIVTGERRYWAHVYLLSENKRIQEGDISVDPAQIKATIASAGITIRAHQLIENLLREDINAIERAQGMWALRYELSGVNYSSPLRQAQGTTSDGIDAENDEVNYSSPLRQAQDTAQLAPWSRVEETLGISKRYRIFVTSVLNLCAGAQEIVKAHSLAEMTIRPIVQKLKDKPDLQIKALNQLIAWQAENESEDGPNRAIVASVKTFVDQLLAGEASKDTGAKITRSVSSAPVVRFHNKVRQTLDFLGRLKADDKEGLTEALGRDEFTDIMIDLRHLRRQIDAIIETVTQAHPPDDTMSPPGV